MSMCVCVCGDAVCRAKDARTPERNNVLVRTTRKKMSNWNLFD